MTYLLIHSIIGTVVCIVWLLCHWSENETLKEDRVITVEMLVWGTHIFLLWPVYLCCLLGAGPISWIEEADWFRAIRNKRVLYKQRTVWVHKPDYSYRIVLRGKKIRVLWK